MYKEPVAGSEIENVRTSLLPDHTFMFLYFPIDLPKTAVP